MAASTSASDSFPRRRRPSKTWLSRLVRFSNMAGIVACLAGMVKQKFGHGKSSTDFADYAEKNLHKSAKSVDDDVTRSDPNGSSRYDMIQHLLHASGDHARS